MEARRPPKARWAVSVFRWSNPVSVDGAQRLPLDPEGCRRVSPVRVSLAGVGAAGAGLYHPLQAGQAPGGFLAQESCWTLAPGTGQHRVESLWGGRMEGASAWLYQTAHLEEAPSKPESTEGIGVEEVCGGKKVLPCIWDNGFDRKTDPREGAPFSNCLECQEE